MPLQKQIIPVSLGNGIDQKTDSKQVLPLNLLRLINGVLTKPKKVAKRNGYDSLGNVLISSSAESALEGGEALGTFEDELLLFNKSTMYSRADFQSSYVSKGSAVPLSYSSQTVIRNSRSQTYADFDTLNGVTLYAWQETGLGVRACVRDEGNGTLFQAEVSISANGARPRVRAVGSYLFVFYVDTVANTICFKRLSPSNPFSFEAEQTLVSSVHATNYHFDVALSGNALVWAVNKSGATAIEIGYVDQFGGNTGYPSNITLAEAASNCLSVFCNATTQQVFITYHNATNGTRAKGYDNTLASLFSTATLDATTAPVTLNITGDFNSENNLLQLVYEVSASNSYDHLIKQVDLTTAGVATNNGTLLRSVGLASKAWSQDDTIYFNIGYQSTLQTTYFTSDLSGNLVSKMLPQVAGDLQASFLPQSLELEEGSWSTVGLFKGQLDSNGGTFFTSTGVKRLNLDFTTEDRYFSSELNENLHITGGFLSMYDGESIVEHNFHLYPENISALGAATGGSQADGAYQYVCVFSWTDRQGNVHRSTSSIPTSITLSGGGTAQKVTLTIPTLRLTAKKSPRAEVVIEVYRTKKNETVFFYVGSVDNTTASNTVSYVDTSSDATVGANRFLYTTGGVLDNAAPPAASFIVASKNRLILGPDENGEFWYSKEKVPGEGISFAEEFKIRLDPQGGEATGLAVMDDKILFGKQRNWYFVSGRGPNDTGAFNDFSEPQMIAVDAGLKNPNATCLMSLGLCYKSEKGIYLLTRSLDAKYIGAPVEDYNEDDILSADLISDVNEVRFLTSSGVALVWNYFTYSEGQKNDWGVFDNHLGLDAILWRGEYCYLRDSEGIVYRENPDSTLDDNRSIQLDIETAWIKTNSIQGFQRIWRANVLGDYLSAHQLQIDVSFDYQDYPLISKLWDPSEAIQTSLCGDGDFCGDDEVAGGVSDGVYQVRLRLSRQKCEAIKFRFRDVMNETTGKSFNLSHLELLCGLKGSLNKMKAAKSI